MGPYTNTKFGNKVIFVCVDHFTKFYWFLENNLPISWEHPNTYTQTMENGSYRIYSPTSSYDMEFKPCAQRFTRPTPIPGKQIRLANA